MNANGRKSNRSAGLRPGAMLKAKPKEGAADKGSDPSGRQGQGVNKGSDPSI
jgi:hypothetical protein